MALATPPIHRNAFRIAIICALPLEAEMVQAAFDENWTNQGHKFGKIPGDANAYSTGLIGGHNVVLAHMPKMGNNNAATTAAGLKFTFRRLEIIFLVGICGAAPIHPETRDEVILGDCIFSTAVVQYDYGRQFDNVFVRKRGLEENLSRANTETQALIARLKITQNRTQLMERWNFYLGQLQQVQQFDYPGAAFDRLYPASYLHKHHDEIESNCEKCYQDIDSCSLDCHTLGCDSAHLLRRDRLKDKDKASASKPLPYIHFGRIGSANSVLRSAALRDKLAETDQIVGFEMECAGVWDVLPTILIKSVCDYADSHKSKDWQPYAAASAAACLKALFEQWETTEPSPTTPTADEQWTSNIETTTKQDHGSRQQLVPVKRPRNHPVHRIKEIDNVLKTPPYEDPLTYHSSLCLEGTATWIFQKETYQRWLISDPPTTSFLWIYAGAGTGKTILCTNIVNALQSHPSLNVFHYFSSAHHGSSSDLSSIVRYWISEMARCCISATNTSMFTLIEMYLHQYGVGRVVADADAWKIFGYLVSQLLNCVFILDGLDEYDRDARGQLLASLKSQLAGKDAKVLLTSRDESDIRMELDSSFVNDPRLSFSSLELSRDDTRSDISLLSEALVNRKLYRKSTAVRSALATTLSDKCDGMFLWVRLTSQSLHAGQTPAMLEKIVNRAPAGLDSVYEDKWRSIMQHPEPDERLRAIAVLRWCTYTFEPLTVAQMAEAIAINLDDRSDEFDENELPEDINEDFVVHGIKGLCSSFVELRSKYDSRSLSDQILHLIHASVKDFLLVKLPEARIRNHLMTSVLSAGSREHLELSKICLRYLSYSNIPATSLPQGKGVDYQFHEYAIKQWHVHQAESQTEDEEFVILTIKFLDQTNAKFARWVSIIEPFTTNPGYNQAQPFYYAALLGLIAVLNGLYPRITKSIDSIGGKYGTALQAACAKGRDETVKLLLDWSADSNMVAGFHGTALAASAAGNHVKITEELLSRGALPDRSGRKEKTALFEAARYNSIQCAVILLGNGADPSSPAAFQWTPLLIAAEFSDVEMVKLLLDNGADIAACNTAGCAPLSIAASRGNLEIIRCLLDRGANIEHSNERGETPLFEAANIGNFKAVQLLLERGANVDTRSNKDETPLIRAVRHCNRKLVELLLDWHADITSKDYEGRTALYWAVERNQSVIRKLLINRTIETGATIASDWLPLFKAIQMDNLSIVQNLLYEGSDIEAKDSDGKTPLCFVIQREKLEIAKFLVSQGADVATIHHWGDAPLMFVARIGHVGLVRKLLLDRDVDLIPRTIVKDLPLHLAIQQGISLDIIKVLLEHSILKPAQYINTEGRTLLQEAALTGDVQVFEYLVAEGFDPMQKDKHGNGVLESCLDSLSEGRTKRLLQQLSFGWVHTDNTGSWSLLHWVCRQGSFSMLKVVVDAGYKVSSVTTSIPQATWAPLDIARFYENTSLLTADGGLDKSHPWDLLIVSGIVESAESSDSLKSVSYNAIIPTSDISSHICDNCRVNIRGPRFRSLNMDDFDYCLMCKHTAEQNGLHPNAIWEYVDRKADD